MYDGDVLRRAYPRWWRILGAANSCSDGDPNAHSNPNADTNT
jgi:hypothetical protein